MSHNFSASFCDSYQVITAWIFKSQWNTVFEKIKKSHASKIFFSKSESSHILKNDFLNVVIDVGSVPTSSPFSQPRMSDHKLSWYYVYIGCIQIKLKCYLELRLFSHNNKYRFRFGWEGQAFNLGTRDTLIIKKFKSGTLRMCHIIGHLIFYNFFRKNASWN